MSNLNADITDLVQPVAGSHAVERVTLGIEWKGELSSQVMQRLSKHLDDLEHPFPRKLEIRAKEVAGSGDVPLSMPSQEEIELIGLVLKSSVDEDDDEDLVNELAIRKEGVFISVAKDYQSWRQTKALVLPVVESILSELVDEITVMAVGLQYVDAFRLLDKVDFERLFNRENENLPAKVFKNENYWHVEVAFFESINESLSHLLTNIQVSHAPPEEADAPEKISITCLTRTYFGSEEEQSPALVLALYDKLYDKNKLIVKDLVSAELGELIGLDEKIGTL